MNLDGRLLRALVALAQERHFGRAARRLNVSQPALSRQIRALERQLGVVLFERSSRHVAPTAAGERFARRATRVLRELDAAVADARGVEHTPDPVHIGVGETVGDGLLDRATAALVRANGPQIVVRAGWGADHVDAVRRGALDLAMGHAIAVPADVREEVIALDPLEVHVSLQHPLAEGTEVSLRELARTTLLVPPSHVAPGACDHLIACCRAAGFEPDVKVPNVLTPPVTSGLRTVLDETTFALLPEGMPVRSGAVAIPLRDAPLVPLLLVRSPEAARRDAAAVADALRAVVRRPVSNGRPGGVSIAHA